MREGPYHIFIFYGRRGRALKIWQINITILKVPDGAWIRLAWIPAAEQFMEPPMSNVITDPCAIQIQI
jgi:hypothetical protein